MWKIIGGVIVGVFVGALALEILNRKKPGLLRGIERKAEESARSFVESFKNGYFGRNGENNGGSLPDEGGA